MVRRRRALASRHALPVSHARPSIRPLCLVSQATIRTVLESNVCHARLVATVNLPLPSKTSLALRHGHPLYQLMRDKCSPATPGSQPPWSRSSAAKAPTGMRPLRRALAAPRASFALSTETTSLAPPSWIALLASSPTKRTWPSARHALQATHAQLHQARRKPALMVSSPSEANSRAPHAMLVMSA